MIKPKQLQKQTNMLGFSHQNQAHQVSLLLQAALEQLNKSEQWYIAGSKTSEIVSDSCMMKWR